MAHITVACLDMAGTTVADDGTVLEAFAAAIAGLPGAAFEQAMTAVRSSMGQSKIEVFRRILGDETASDIESGRRAGAAIVAGVLTGASTRADLEQAGAPLILDTIADLLPYVSTNLG
jgi:ribonucleotide monophosphatase NagD (HAD superfamily)